MALTVRGICGDLTRATLPGRGPNGWKSLRLARSTRVALNAWAGMIISPLRWGKIA
ncbi:hypothetical protein FQZ97_1212420 [compost metagenome]